MDVVVVVVVTPLCNVRSEGSSSRRYDNKEVDDECDDNGDNTLRSYCN